jgi:hypothetical protein
VQQEKLGSGNDATVSAHQDRQLALRAAFRPIAATGTSYGARSGSWETTSCSIAVAFSCLEPAATKSARFILKPEQASPERFRTMPVIEDRELKVSTPTQSDGEQQKVQ